MKLRIPLALIPTILLAGGCRAPGSQSPARDTASAPTAVAAPPRKLDPAPLEKIFGLQAAVNDEEAVVKFSVPRTDVRITVDDFAMPPFMGLTSWAAFHSGARPRRW